MRAFKKNIINKRIYKIYFDIRGYYFYHLKQPGRLGLSAFVSGN